MAHSTYDYVIGNFGDRDALDSGDPGKTIKGSLFEEEFKNIKAAVNAKADLVSPAFEGFPTLEASPSPNDGSLKIATTAYVDAAVSGSVAGVSSIVAGTGVSITYTGETSGTGAVTVNTSSNVPLKNGNNTFTNTNLFEEEVQLTNIINKTGHDSGDFFRVGAGTAVTGAASACILSTANTASKFPIAAQHVGTAGNAGTAFSAAVASTSGYLSQYLYLSGGSFTEVGTISTNGSSTAYNTTSDYRLKTNVVPSVNGIDKLKQLKVVNFNWKNNLDAGKVDGFLAHEVADVIPDAVTGTKDAVNADGTIKAQGLDQSKLVPMLTKALQEAVARIEALEADVAALKAA